MIIIYGRSLGAALAAELATHVDAELRDVCLRQSQSLRDTYQHRVFSRIDAPVGDYRHALQLQE